MSEEKDNFIIKGIKRREISREELDKDIEKVEKEIEEIEKMSGKKFNDLMLNLLKQDSVFYRILSDPQKAMIYIYSTKGPNNGPVFLPDRFQTYKFSKKIGNLYDKTSDGRFYLLDAGLAEILWLIHELLGLWL